MAILSICHVCGKDIWVAGGAVSTVYLHPGCERPKFTKLRDSLSREQRTALTAMEFVLSLPPPPEQHEKQIDDAG